MNVLVLSSGKTVFQFVGSCSLSGLCQVGWVRNLDKTLNIYYFMAKCCNTPNEIFDFVLLPSLSHFLVFFPPLGKDLPLLHFAALSVTGSVASSV